MKFDDIFLLIRNLFGKISFRFLLFVCWLLTVQWLSFMWRFTLLIRVCFVQKTLWFLWFFWLFWLVGWSKKKTKIKWCACFSVFRVWLVGFRVWLFWLVAHALATKLNIFSGFIIFHHHESMNEWMMCNVNQTKPNDIEWMNKCRRPQ